MLQKALSNVHEKVTQVRAAHSDFLHVTARCIADTHAANATADSGQDGRTIESQAETETATETETEIETETETETDTKKTPRDEDELGLQDVTDLFSAYSAAMGRTLDGFIRVTTPTMNKLKNELDVIEAETSCYREALVQGAKDVLSDETNAKNNSHTCPICFEREVDTCCVPCGHTLCEECSKRMASNVCGTCRNRVSNHVRLFFSL